jgi:hypothetical protein
MAQAGFHTVVDEEPIVVYAPNSQLQQLHQVQTIGNTTLFPAPIQSALHGHLHPIRTVLYITNPLVLPIPRGMEDNRIIPILS